MPPETLGARVFGYDDPWEFSAKRAVIPRLALLVRIIVAFGEDAHTVFVSPDNTEAKIGIPLVLVNVLIVRRAVNIKTFCQTSSYFSGFLFRTNPIYGLSHNQALSVSQCAFTASRDIRQWKSKTAWQRKLQHINV